MAEEALLTRMSGSAWGDGILLKDLRAHLKPLVELEKENADVYDTRCSSVKC